jgi:peptidoglycan/xylan/chitin deacetylase (PgdA/CDA1 family)
MSALTIVMYHYVRDLARCRYPRLKALTIEAFEGQLDYLARHYQVVSVRDVVAAAHGARPLPPGACLLTFDDAFADHFSVVLPRLRARGFSAGFYPPAVAVEERRVLDTHKVHVILAAASDHTKVARRIQELIEEQRCVWDLPAAEMLYQELAQPSRFDTAEVIFIKRSLQRALPAPLRAAITQRLFDEYAGADEATVAAELYMTRDQLRAMVDEGMDVGGHGAEHVWLGGLPTSEQASEIERTRTFLASVHGRPVENWVMCYPFGSYDATTLELLRGAGCALGLTTRVDVAKDLAAPLELPRLDTNDLPTRGDAGASKWACQ